MTYYEILGLNRRATDQEIKLAYRKLVKLFHPDRNKSEEAKRAIVLINEAYETLADPNKREMYDNPNISAFPEPAYEQDPREINRMEYIRKKNEGAKIERARKEQLERRIFTFFRWISFPSLVFATLLVGDFYLPAVKYDESAEKGWQEIIRRKYNRSELKSYMQTRHFAFRVPHEVHLNYPYLEEVRPLLQIHVTPIFKTVKVIELQLDGNSIEFLNAETIYALAFPIHWALLLSSLFTVVRREFSLATYSLCGLPFLLLLTIIIMMM